MHSRSGADQGRHNNLHLLTYLLTYAAYLAGLAGATWQRCVLSSFTADRQNACSNSVLVLIDSDKYEHRGAKAE